MKPSSTESCVKALRVLSQDIQSEDGVANAALAECADRIEKLAELVVSQQERIKRLEQDIKNTEINTDFINMVDVLPPPIWEETHLKLESQLVDTHKHITELENRLRVLWDKYYSDSNYYEKRMCMLIEAGDVMYDFINPPSPCMRTVEIDNILQGWDDTKIGMETKP